VQAYRDADCADPRAGENRPFLHRRDPRSVARPAPAGDECDGHSVELSTGVVVETGVPNYRSIRGRSICVALFDEVAFLRSDESANPDTEIVNAVSPSLGRFGLDGVLLFGSTPYAKRGVLYDGWSEYHGNDTGEALCWYRDPHHEPDFLARAD